MDPQANSPQIVSSPQGVTQPQTVYYRHAGFLVRLFANIIDTFLVFALAFPIAWLMQKFANINFAISTESNSNFMILAVIILLIYEVTFLTRYGATLGKKLLKLKVVDTHYQKVHVWTVLARQTIASSIAGVIFDLGFYWIIFDKKKQGWHDKLVSTYVIHTKPLATRP